MKMIWHEFYLARISAKVPLKDFKTGKEYNLDIHVQLLRYMS